MKIGVQLICKKDYRYDTNVNVSVGEKCIIIDNNILNSKDIFYYSIKNMNTEYITIIHSSEVSDYFETIHEHRQSIINELI